MNSIMIFIAKYFYIISVFGIIIFFLKQPRAIKKSLIICSIIIAPLSYIIAKISGALYYDPRPFVVGNFIPLLAHSADNGFPSDHTLLASAIAMIVWFYNKKISYWFWLIAILIGVARIYVGIHHVVDILGSIIIVIISGIIYFALKKYKKIS